MPYYPHPLNSAQPKKVEVTSPPEETADEHLRRIVREEIAELPIRYDVPDTPGDDA